jgi:hypothetical protein
VIKKQLRRSARQLFRSLLDAQLVEVVRATEKSRRFIRVHPNLQKDFSLFHTLSLYLVEALAVLDKESESYGVDLLTLVESILESPMVILNAQLKKAQGELIDRLKAEGVEYEDRMKELERITYPKPNAEIIYETFNAFAARHPWAFENIRPKSVARDMYERYMTFADYIREYGLARSEGVLLRYLSESYKTLMQTVPKLAKNDSVVDVEAFLRATLERIDSSLVQEWESLVTGEASEDGLTPLPERKRDISRDHKAFVARIRHELFAFVRALARRDYEEAAAWVHPDSDLSEAQLSRAMDSFFDDYGELDVSPRARTADRVVVEQLEPHYFRVRQSLLDPEDESLWFAEGFVDLRQDTAPEGVLVRLTHLGT